MNNRLIRQEVYQKLRGDILSCALPPGEEFREGELVEKFGVSKSPIRDALQRLELEGLVEISPRRGHRVAPISVLDAEDMLDMREILEAGAIRAIATKASDTELRRFDQFREANLDNMQKFASYNRAFHMHLSEASGNRRLANSMAQLMENYDRLCIVSLTSTRDQSGGMELALADHNTLIDALQARNVAAAVRASSRHLKKSRSSILRGLQNRPIVA